MIIQDLRFTLRRLCATPTFTTAAILSLALGISATTVTFGIVDTIDLRPLPFEHSEHLVSLRETRSVRESWCSGCPVGASVAHYQVWRVRSRLYDEMAAARGSNVGVRMGDAFVRLTAVEATASLFRLFGVRPLVGRALLPADEQAGAEPVALLSEAVWQERFAADPHIVGRAIQITQGGAGATSVGYIVVGIVPRRFVIQPGGDVWIPLRTEAGGLAGSMPVSVMASLKEGVSRARATAELTALVHQLENDPTGTSISTARGRGAIVRPLRDDFVAGAGPARFVLFGICTCVLLIVAANVASLFLSRGLAREREFTIRSALGASRWRMTRQLLTETVVVSLAGGALALLLADWGMIFLMSRLHLENIGLRAAVDVRVVMFTVVLAVVVGLSSGIAPALGLRSLAEGTVLRRDSLRTSASRTRIGLQRLFVVGQLSCALILLTGAGLFSREYARLRDTDAGFDVDNLAYGAIAISDTGEVGQRDFAARARSSIRRVADVAGASIIGYPAFDGSVVVEKEREPLAGGATPLLRSVDPDFFRTLGIPVRAGRVFGPDDGYGSRPVGILSELAARRYWQGEDAVGKHLRLRPIGRPEEVVTIVGIVADARLFDPLEKAEPTLYRPIEQAPSADLGVFLRATGPRQTVLPHLRETIDDLTAGPVWSDAVFWLKDHFSEALDKQRFVAGVLLSFAFLGVGLAALGVYGIAAYAATRRTREVGIRIALGADRGVVLAMVLKETATLAIAGIALGLLGSLICTRVLRSLLVGAGGPSIYVFLGAAMVLIVVVMLAGYTPAARLARVDPAVTLRAE